MLSKKKKIFIVGGFCLLLAITGVLNIVLNKNIVSSASRYIISWLRVSVLSVR